MNVGHSGSSTGFKVHGQQIEALGEGQQISRTLNGHSSWLISKASCFAIVRLGRSGYKVSWAHFKLYGTLLPGFKEYGFQMFEEVHPAHYISQLNGCRVKEARCPVHPISVDVVSNQFSQKCIKDVSDHKQNIFFLCLGHAPSGHIVQSVTVFQVIYMGPQGLDLGMIIR